MKPFLRYPGGKSRHVNKILRYFRKDEPDYREPFIGGGSVYLASGFQNAWINDVDPSVYDIWRMVKERPEALITIMSCHTEIIMHHKEPERIQKAIELWRSIQDDVDHKLYPAGYRFLFLNKTCFNGVQDGGPTGGLHQTGKYELGSRWAYGRTANLICHVSKALQDCRITNLDWKEVVKDATDETCFYLDPPYLGKGEQCYEYFFTEQQHLELAQWAATTPNRFVITVDDCEEIRDIYRSGGVASERMLTETWFYSMSDYRDSNREGKELFIADAESMRLMKRQTPRRKVMREIA